MSSLEANQGVHNAHIANAGNVTASNSPTEQLIEGAQNLAAGNQLGLSEEEVLAAVSRKRRKQRPARLTNDELRQWQQRAASLTDADGNSMPEELRPGTRTVPNSQVQFEQDNGERDQSTIQEFSGSLDEQIKERSKARRESKKGGRDTNKFITYDKGQGRFVEEYIEDGQPTPDDLRDQALLQDYGMRRIKTGQEPVLDRRGQPVFNQEGEQIFRNTYDFENIAAHGGLTQGDGDPSGKPAGSSFSPAGDALKQIEVAIQLGKISPEEAAPLIERLRRTADPQYDKKVIDYFGRRTAQKDNERFTPAAKAISDARAARDATAAVNQDVNGSVIARGIMSGQAGVDDAPYIPGRLTPAKQDPGLGVDIAPSYMADGDERYASRPQAVALNEDALAIAQALGQDVTGYVDVETGQPVTGTAPARLQQGGLSDQQLNAPIGSGAHWVLANQFDNSPTDGSLAQANISQATADFSRRVQAFAPNYQSRPVTNIAEFEQQIGRVIEARQAAGKNFYLRNADTGRNEKVEPSIASALQLLRMSEGQKRELASALFQREMAQTAGLGAAASPGVTVSRGTMFGSENLDLGRAPRDTTRAAFARLTDSDAQMPIIGAIRERDSTGTIISEQPKPTRQVMKGRTPAEAVQVYAEQRRAKGEKPSRARGRQIYTENASLRRDQQKTDIMNSIRDLNQQSTTGAPPPRVAEDQAFSENEGGRATRQMELAEKIRLRGGTPIGPGGALVSQRTSSSSSAPSQYYDGSSKYDVVSSFESFSAPGGGGPKSPPPAAVSAPEPEPNNDTDRAFRTSVVEAIQKENRNRRRKYGYGAAGAGTLAALTAALTGGEQQEEEVAYR